MLPRTLPGFRRSGNLHRRRPASCGQDGVDRDDDLLDRGLNLPWWTTRCARSCASSSPSPAFALMRSMIPRPSRRAASSTSESRRPSRAARTRTWRMRPSSIDSVVFTLAIFPYCHRHATRLTGSQFRQGIETLRRGPSPPCVYISLMFRGQPSDRGVIY
jgi:hypothetical protein